MINTDWGWKSFILAQFRLRAIPQDGHASEESASEEIERNEGKPRGSWGGGDMLISQRFLYLQENK